MCDIQEMIEESIKPKIDNKQKDTTTFELKVLEKQLNKYELDRKKSLKFKKITFDFSDGNKYEAKTLNDVIDNEIIKKYKEKKWTALPPFLKWKIMQIYIEEKNITDKKVIAKLKENLDNVKTIIYDHINQKILDTVIVE